MKRTEIYKEFTQATNEYMTQGYYFTSSMRGHQGEEMKVDLTNGSETIRISLTSFQDPRSEHGIFDRREGIEITVEKFNEAHTNHTIWTGRGETIKVKKFYKLGRQWGEPEMDIEFTTDTEHCDECFRKAMSRLRSEPSEPEMRSDRAKEAALKIVKKQPRCKTKKLSDIECVRKNRYGGYTIELTNRTTFRIG